jgi:ABC-type transporter Mla MlaB component
MIVLVIDGPLALADVPRLCERARLALKGVETKELVCDVAALVHPDAGAVDALARLQLAARRLGHRILLLHASRELQDLLALMGLGEVLPPCPTLALDAGGEAEERKQPLGVEEEADPADPIA